MSTDIFFGFAPKHDEIAKCHCFHLNLNVKEMFTKKLDGNFICTVKNLHCTGSYLDFPKMEGENDTVLEAVWIFRNCIGKKLHWTSAV